MSRQIVARGAWMLATVSLCASVAAQTSPEPDVTPVVRNVSRVERWSFFEPAAGGGDHDYTLFGNRATFGVVVDGRRVALDASFQYAQLVGLPQQSFGPGPLGPGATFFEAARNTRAYQLYFKSLALRVKNVVPRLSIAVGRMPYASGEDTPFAGRLIGNAEWTVFERAFDGIRADYERPAWRAHASFFMPTQGAFEESASPTIGKVQLASVSWTGHDVQLFAHTYRDTRAVRGRPDNTGLLARRADVAVRTAGASLARPVGTLDLRLWGAVQRGHWYGDAHRAGSASAEAGYSWADTRWRPSVAAGVLYASGDDDPNDTVHGTFFPMVPTTTPALLSGTFAQMNLHDVYARGGLTPHPRLSLTMELHRLSLVSRLDRWYSGTGATAIDGNYFGYSSRPSTLAHGLGTYVQIGAITPVTPHWRIAASAGVMRGGAVIRRQFAGPTLTVFALENTLAWP